MTEPITLSNALLDLFDAMHDEEPMTADELAEIRERCAIASAPSRGPGMTVIVPPRFIELSQSIIADVPRLLAEIERLKADNARLQNYLRDRT